MDNVLDNVIDSKLTGNDPGAIEDTEGKTFSQEEVNNIIRDRLSKEKDKTQKQVEALTKEYQQKELNFKAKELLSSKGLSADILEALKFEDEDTLNKSVYLLETVINKARNNPINPTTQTVIRPVSGGEVDDSNQQIREAMGLKK